LSGIGAQPSPFAERLFPLRGALRTIVSAEFGSIGAIAKQLYVKKDCKKGKCFRLAAIGVESPKRACLSEGGLATDSAMNVS